MADLVLEQCRPSQRAKEIRALFQRAGKPEFEAVFDRSYLPLESAGIRSWVGLEGEQANLHISVTPLAFSDGSRAYRGGLLGDLMADPTQRDFWGPLKLVRQMVSDVKKAGELDFLLTTYLPAAESVFKAGGFKRFADLRRNVAPLFRPYLLLRRLQGGLRTERVTEQPHDLATVESLLARLPSRGLFRPASSADFYRVRIPRQGWPSGRWLIVGDPANPSGAVLACPSFTPKDTMIADLLWRDGPESVPGILASVARWLSAQGFWRLQMRTLSDSACVRLGSPVGFFVRPETYGLMMLPLKKDTPIPALDQWALMSFALTGW